MATYFWRTDLLAADLAADRVSEASSVRYMMISSALYVQSYYWSVWFGGFRDSIFFLELITVLLVSLIGVHECYKANDGASGRQFITRFCALGVPIGLKLAIFGSALSVGLFYLAPRVLAGGQFRDPALVYRFIAFVMPVVLTFAYYWRIAYHIERTVVAERITSQNKMNSERLDTLN